MQRSQASEAKSYKECQESGSRVSSTSISRPGPPTVGSSKSSALGDSSLKCSTGRFQSVASQMILPVVNSLIDSHLFKLRDLVTASVSFGMQLYKLSSEEFPFQHGSSTSKLQYPQETDTFQRSIEIHKTNWIKILETLKHAKLAGLEILPAGWEADFLEGKEELIAEFLVFWIAFLNQRFPEFLLKAESKHPDQLHYILSGQITECFEEESEPLSGGTPSKAIMMSRFLQASAKRKKSGSEPLAGEGITPEKVRESKQHILSETDHSRMSFQDLLVAVQGYQTTNRVLRDDLIFREKEVMALKDELISAKEDAKYYSDQISDKDSEIRSQQVQIQNLKSTLDLISEKSGKSVWQAKLEAAEQRAEMTVSELELQVKINKELERKYYQLLSKTQSGQVNRDLWTSEDLDAQKGLESRIRVTELENHQLKDKLAAQEETISELTEKLMVEKSNNDEFSKQFSHIHSVATQRELALSLSNQTCTSLRNELEHLKDQLESKNISMRKLEIELNQIVQNGHTKNTEVLAKMVDLSGEGQGNINLVHVCREMSRLHLMETELLHSFLHDFVVTELTGTPLQALVENRLHTNFRQ